MSEAEKLKHCLGCEQDFYNDKNPLGVKRCWHLKDAKLVTRYRTGTWTTPATPGAFTKVRVFQCRRETGQHFSDSVPGFAVDVRDETEGR